jgi:hypothetical protein
LVYHKEDNEQQYIPKTPRLTIITTPFIYYRRLGVIEQLDAESTAHRLMFKLATTGYKMRFRHQIDNAVCLGSGHDEVL